MTTQPTTTMRRDGTTATVIVENTYPTDQNDLWDAITNPARLARWLATVTGDPASGAPMALTFTSGWEGTGTIRECHPPQRLVVDTLTTDGEAGTISATLTPSPDGSTTLRVEESNLPLTGLHNYAAGWQLHLEDLATDLDGATPQPLRERFLTLAPTLAEQPIIDR